MSSDGRPRDEDRRRRRRLPTDQPGGRQSEAQQDLDRPQQPRRRTSYVPRQGSGQPRQFASDRSDLDQSREPTAPRRAQQPDYRQQQPRVDRYDYYEEPVGDEEHNQEPVASSPRRQSRYQGDVNEQYASRRSPGVEYDDDYSEQYDDSFIDEDDWYEEEAAAGAARPRSSRGRGRQARTAPRPSISLPRPSLPRPTVPVKVREAAFIRDHNAIILSAGLLLSALLMTLFTSNRMETLAPGFATHISASGLPESIRSESALWRLPLMAGSLFLMNAVLAWFTAQRSRFLSRFFLITVALVHILLWVAFVRIAY